MNELAQLKFKIARARYNLMFMIILSIVNVVFVSSGNAVAMPFSSTIATYSTAIGITAAKDNNNDTYKILGLLIACIVLGLFIFCYFMSKKKGVYLVIAFTLLSADTLALLVMNASTGSIGQVFVLLDLLLHILTLVYIFGGIKAHIHFSKLPKFNEVDEPIRLNDNDFGAKESTPLYVNESEDDDLEDEIEDEESEEDMTKPISEYVEDGGERLVSGSYSGLDVFVVIKDNVAELVINNYVCDSFDFSEEDEYGLRAIVNGIDFTFEYKLSKSGEAMYLYADDTLLDSLGRN